MRYPKEQKEQTRGRILDAAGRLFRERGYDGVGVDAIMAAVGLTPGGFYSHFASKEALFAEALGHAYDSRHEDLQANRQGKDAADADDLQNLIFGYLSRTHRDMTAEGCIFPALTTDVVRGGAETRAAFEERLKRFLSSIEASLSGGDAPERERALAILVQLIGGVLLARAVKDETLSGDILKACRQAAMAMSKKGP